MDVTGKFISVTHKPARDDWPEKWNARFLPDGASEWLDADVEAAPLAAELGKLKQFANVAVQLELRTVRNAYQAYRFRVTAVTPL